MIRYKQQAAEMLTPLLDEDAGAVAESLVKPPRPEMGDLGFPCFQLARKRKSPPAKIALDLAEGLSPPAGGIFARVAAEGPYVNFYLDPVRLGEATVGPILADPEDWGSSAAGAGRTAVIEYSSPNIAKPLGVHHIRSTMLGAALARIYRARGWRVVEMNHLGDWGTTFGQLMVAYKRKEGEDPSQPVDVHSLLRLYLRYHAEAEAEAGLAGEARAWFKRLEDGDPEAARLWRIFRDESVKALKRLYDRLGVHFPEEGYKGEAFYNDRLEATLAGLRGRGLLKESEGALVVDLEPWGMPPCLIRKSDGASIYATRDLASAEYRYETYRFDRSLYVVANQQELHFRQVFKTLELMGYPWAGRCEHVKFGMLSFGPGVFGEAAATGSTRRGRVVFLEEVLDRAVEKARRLIVDNARSPGEPADPDGLAEKVGVGAVVFSEFLQRRQKDVSFTWERALNLHGDSGPYLQYTHARLSSMLRRYGKPVNPAPDWEALAGGSFKDIFLALSEYPEVMGQAEAENEPSLVAAYLLDLAARFNRVYTDKENHRFLSGDERLAAARLAVVEAIRLTLSHGLGLLGLAAPESM
ncbi:MAG: arginine--tRNA ligase [Planctomycetota bacterium]|jgi:arginyl-tRNA synthetase|nr:arginine--tRNA ligase [Planctomycetota bacterium]